MSGRRVWFPLLLLVGAAAGLVVGFVATSAVSAMLSDEDAAVSPLVGDGEIRTQPETAESPSASSAVPSTSQPPVPVPSTTTAAPSAVPDGPVTVLAWTAGGLPAGFAREVAKNGSLADISVVAGADLEIVHARSSDGTTVLDLDQGWRISLDTIAVDPSTYGLFVDPADRELIRDLGPGSGILTATAAEIRGLSKGGQLTTVDGSTITIDGIVTDLSGAGSELVVSRGGSESLGLTVDRFLLGKAVVDRTVIDQALREALEMAQRVPAPLRVRVAGESPYLRHGDAVLTQAQVKRLFGEFSYRPLSGRDIEIDEEWSAENIVEMEVPILGPIRCHRLVAPLIGEVMARLEADLLTHLIEPSQFAGCHAPRRIGAGLPLSRHAWGIAVDLNIGSNPRGNFSSKDPRLSAVMMEYGFGWGGEWLVPDPGHYEYLTTASGR